MSKIGLLLSQNVPGKYSAYSISNILLDEYRNMMNLKNYISTLIATDDPNVALENSGLPSIPKDAVLAIGANEFIAFTDIVNVYDKENATVTSNLGKEYLLEDALSAYNSVVNASDEYYATLEYVSNAIGQGRTITFDGLQAYLQRRVDSIDPQFILTLQEGFAQIDGDPVTMIQFLVNFMDVEVSSPDTLNFQSINGENYTGLNPVTAMLSTVIDYVGGIFTNWTDRVEQMWNASVTIVGKVLNFFYRSAEWLYNLGQTVENYFTNDFKENSSDADAVNVVNVPTISKEITSIQLYTQLFRTFFSNEDGSTVLTPANGLQFGNLCRDLFSIDTGWDGWDRKLVEVFGVNKWYDVPMGVGLVRFGFYYKRNGNVNQLFCGYEVYVSPNAYIRKAPGKGVLYSDYDDPQIGVPNLWALKPSSILTGAGSDPYDRLASEVFSGKSLSLSNDRENLLSCHYNYSALSIIAQMMLTEADIFSLSDRKNMILTELAQTFPADNFDVTEQAVILTNSWNQYIVNYIDQNQVASTELQTPFKAWLDSHAGDPSNKDIYNAFTSSKSGDRDPWNNPLSFIVLPIMLRFMLNHGAALRDKSLTTYGFKFVNCPFMNTVKPLKCKYALCTDTDNITKYTKALKFAGITIGAMLSIAGIYVVSYKIKNVLISTNSLLNSKLLNPVLPGTAGYDEWLQDVKKLSKKTKLLNAITGYVNPLTMSSTAGPAVTTIGNVNRVNDDIKQIKQLIR